jgi:indolepyruvate ferredoxin oxidoreductase
LEAKGVLKVSTKPDPVRVPHFCSGCPHNTSTKIPKAAVPWLVRLPRYGVVITGPRNFYLHHMGAEGTTGSVRHRSPTNNTVFTNWRRYLLPLWLVGIRASVAAKVNTTYKILINDAVAMTGGQTVDGPLDPAMISC